MCRIATGRQDTLKKREEESTVEGGEGVNQKRLSPPGNYKGTRDRGNTLRSVLSTFLVLYYYKVTRANCGGAGGG